MMMIMMMTIVLGMMSASKLRFEHQEPQTFLCASVALPGPNPRPIKRFRSGVKGLWLYKQSFRVSSKGRTTTVEKLHTRTHTTHTYTHTYIGVYTVH